MAHPSPLALIGVYGPRRLVDTWKRVIGASATASLRVLLQRGIGLSQSARRAHTSNRSLHGETRPSHSTLTASHFLFENNHACVT
ncbi:hypothetical protein [Asaia sp. VD9]|uniref:hypothetical protein n=1 Tax=Asaia sp. VD9 TaxID=3081235 RepID=UPI003016CFE0